MVPEKIKVRKYAIILSLLAISIVIMPVFYFARKKDVQPINQLPISENDEEEKKPVPEHMPEKVLLDVPFTPQAPLGNWDDIREQNGCEEASLLMAMAWVKNEEISPEAAEREIRKMSDYHLSAHGHFHDLSNADTLGLLKEYFNYQKAYIVENIGSSEIKAVLLQNKVAIIPIDGRLIGNPFYQDPGLANHKIIIIGYDDSSQEFITHDPGTSQGKNFRYAYKKLEESIADYPTGLHEKFKDRKTSMIVVEK